MGFGCWVLGVGVIFGLGFLDMIMVLHLDQLPKQFYLLGGFFRFFFRFFFLLLLLDQHSDFSKELLLIHHKSTSGRMFLVLVQSS